MTEEQLKEKVKAMIANGNLIDATKLVMDTRKIGLREAKEYVDKFR